MSLPRYQRRVHTSSPLPQHSIGVEGGEVGHGWRGRAEQACGRDGCGGVSCELKGFEKRGYECAGC